MPRSPRQPPPDQVQDDLNAPSFTATPKQVTFIEALMSGLYTFLAIGGGIRGTKTWATLASLILLCRIFPRSRWAIVRKDLPTLRRNTIPSMEKIRATCEDFVGELNQSTWTYKCTNGSEILLFPEGIERDPELNRWKGLEVNGFLLEEANELADVSWNKAIERAGSWIIPGTRSNPNPDQPPPFVLSTFNPCNNWPRIVFYEPYMAGQLKPPYFYLPSTVADNPYLPEAYLENLKNLPPQVYDRFVKGLWDVMDDPDQLIPTQLILDAQNVEPTPGPRRMGVDVARFGDDLSVICHVLGNALTSIDTFSGLRTTAFADIIHGKAVANEIPIEAEDIKADSVGVGGGTVDRLHQLGWKITEIIAGAKPIKRAKTHPLYTIVQFHDLKTQIWYEFYLMLKLGLISFPQELPPRLLADLTAVHYYIQADKTLRVESKEDLKKRISRSTDVGDATVMAYFEMPKRPNRSKIPPTFSYSSLR